MSGQAPEAAVERAVSTSSGRSESDRLGWPNYATVWRWHFYAGIFCIPLVLVLSVTGTIYLFRPQIEAWQERDLDRLPRDGQAVTPVTEQVAAALTRIPDSRFAALEMPAADADETTIAATRVLVDSPLGKSRVYVHPDDAKVVCSVVDDERFIRVVRRIHGELLLGKRGSYLVELAASWTIVMVITGMVLWMPRKFRAAGVLYPRWNVRQGKVLWRDLHSVGGFWVSGLILFLVVTGLPWSTFWGDYFKSMRRWTGTDVAAQHWESGHAQHTGAGEGKTPRKTGGAPSWRKPAPDPSSYSIDELPGVVAFAQTLPWLAPVVISPPSDSDSVWTIKSETANRPHRQTIRYDAAAGSVIDHTTFCDQHWVDQLVGQGIALHEGQRFGWANQLIALLATVGLVGLSCTGIILWWRRRDGPGLSPPGLPKKRPAVSRFRAALLLVTVMLLGVYLPLFGVSLIAVLLADILFVSRVPSLATWLGRAT
ncbi:PepSY-associated TM helix domain-containing protein [Stieleria varia]|uniref:PepSY-associated TM helix n=1 Tax=Stieleria varia TaxID=2528005 RepID=A0A5C6A8T6_9BACT|nr:PepSY domain-containing protein [Stieleria varia]TWT94703.1 PepSY-associated TM helix [Stieleria varia]